MSDEITNQADAAITLYGHRGGGAPNPDETVSNYNAGINWGADFVEPDVYLTKDGVLVCSHDNSAVGFANETYAEALAADPSLLTFAQVIELVQQASIDTGRDIGIIPELKDQSTAAAQALVDTLVAHDFTDPDRVIVQSFGSANLKLLHDTIMPAAHVDFQLLQLTYGATASQLADYATYADIWAPSVGYFSASDVAAAHADGLKVVAWTVTGTQSEIQPLIQMGVDGVFENATNDARPAVEALQGVTVIYGTTNWDVVSDSADAGDTMIYAMGGDDIVRAGSGNDVVYGDAGNDVLFGGKGNDHLVGGGGTDFLAGGEGTNVLDGSAGNDVIVASGTGDQVVFNQGDGIDLVSMNDTTTISFGDIKSTDVTVIKDGANLIIRVNDDNSNNPNIEDVIDALVIRNGGDAAHLPASITFADGVTWSTADLLSHAVAGSDAAVAAALPGLEYVLANAPGLETPSTIAIGTDLVANDGIGNGHLVDTVANAEDGAVYRLSFSLAEIAGSGEAAVKVLWNGQVIYEGVPAEAGSTFHFEVVGGSGDGSNQLVFEGAADPAVFDASLADVHLVKLADPGVPVAGNAAPVAEAASLSVSQDLTYTGHVTATDADNDPLVYSLGDGPQHGTLKFNADGTYTYTPDAGYTGADGFTYIANDGHGGADEAAISLTVKAGVLVGTDLIVNGGFEDLSASTGNNGAGDWGYRNTNGSIVGWTEVNTGRIEQHWDTDNGVSAKAGQIWIDMNGYQNNTDIVQNVSHVETGATYELSFSLADADSVAGVTDGIKVLWGGQVVWQGTAPATGWETITIRVIGGKGDGLNQLEFVGTQSNPSASTYGAALDDVHLVKIADVAEVPSDNQAPVATDGSATGTFGAVITGQLSATDPNGDASLTYSLQQAASHGTVVVKADGTFVYTPTDGYSGEDVFIYTVDDGHGGTATATETLTIGKDPAPVNLIVNGSFEDLTGANDSASWGYRNTNPAGVIAGWVNTSDTRAEVHKDTIGGISAEDGTYWFDMEGAPKNATLVQTVAGVVQGATYQLKFSIADTDTAQTTDSIAVYWGGKLIYTGTPQAAWQEITIDVVGGAGDGSNKLVFQSTTPSPNGAGVALDNVSMIKIDANPNLIVNGSFEDLTGAYDGSATSSDWGFRNDNGIIAGWKQVNTSGGGRAEIHHDTHDGVSAEDGKYWFDMDGVGNNAKLVQTVAGVVTGKTYELQFSIADSDSTTSDDGIRVYWNGQVVYEGKPGQAWETITLHVVGGAGDGTNQLIFEGTETNLNTYGVALDNVSLRQTIDTTIAGTAGNDTLTGTAGHDVIAGGAGNDILQGGADSDTYLYAAGDGSDVIVEAAGATGTDVLSFTDLNRADVVFQRHGSDVEIVVKDGSKITLTGQLSGGGIEMVTFADGTTMTGAAIVAAITDRAPVAVADTLSAINQDSGAFTISAASLLGNDTDADLDQLTITGVGAAVGGTVSLQSDGSILFTPASGFNGQASFQYTISDGQGGTSTANVDFTVNAAPTGIIDIPAGQFQTTPVTVTETTHVTVEGTLSPTDPSARGIDAKSALASGSTLTVDVSVSGQILSGDDAIRVNKDLANGHIAIDNAGSITSLTGQAIDLVGVVSASTTIAITNEVTGRIVAVDADAIRPGANTVIDNYGQILVSSQTEDKNDAIDFQDDGGGTVNNYSRGVISGARHGITGTHGITVTNDVGGMIIGNSGSAVNIDNGENGEIVYVTNHGTMIGAAQEGYSDSDGDAIDVDGLLHLVNDGQIQGLGAYGYHDGGVNVSEGIAAGGGYIENDANGVIYGYGRAIQIDDSANGAAQAATTIVNAGTIQGDGHGPADVDAADAAAMQALIDGREAIDIIGTQDDSITNSGRIIGGIFTDGGNDTLVNTGTIAGHVDMGDGNDVVTLGAGSHVTGTIDLGAGDDTLDASASTATVTIDGTVVANVVTVDGGAGNDHIIGSAGNDVIHGGTGNDVLAGGDGSDTYTYAAGDGVDTITEGTGQSGDADKLVFTDVAVTLYKHGNDLDIVTADGGKVTVVDQFAGVTGEGIETIVLDNGETLDHDAITANLTDRGPVAADVTLPTVAEDAQSFFVSFATLLAGASDADLDALSISGVSDFVGGSAVLTDGGLMFTLTADYNGTASFSFTVDDGRGGTAVANASFAVTPVNDAPDVAPVSPVVTDEDVPVSGQVIATDVDGDPLTYTIKGDGAANGTVTIDEHGVWTYTPTENYHGSDSFIVTVSDGTVPVDVAVSVTVNSVNDLPQTTNDAAEVHEHDVASFNLVANDTDVEDGIPHLTGFTVTGVDGIDVSAATAASAFQIVNGQLQFNGGDIFSALNDGEHATVTLNYTVEDNDGGHATGQFVLTIDGQTDLHLITGTSGADVLNDTAGADHIVAGDGNDVILSSFGNDVIDAGAGNDTVITQFGDKVVNGGDGNDTIIGGVGNSTLNGDDGNDTIVGGSGNETINGGAGNDTLSAGSGVNVISGGDGNDTIVGGAGNSTLNGDAGNDTILGGVGSEVINGGAGNDLLMGNAGDDIIAGGAGNDQLFGGSGSDTFVFKVGDGKDTVFDFQAQGTGHDVIELDHAAFADYEALMSSGAVHDAAGGVQIAYNDGSVLTLTGVSKASLKVDDFHFA